MSKEAHAHIKINKLLEEAGWIFFSENGSLQILFLKIKPLLLNKSLKNLEMIFKPQRMVLLIIYSLMIKDFPSLSWKQKRKKLIRCCKRAGKEICTLSKLPFRYFIESNN